MPRENDDVAIRFEILGDLRVRDGEEPIPVPSRRQRKLLAILLAARDRAVTVDRLMDLMWDGDVEAGSKSALRFHISKLRSALEPGTPARDSVIETVATGYRMAVPPEFVDAWNLEQTAQDALGEAGTNPAPATEVLSRIVASRGQLLNDFIYDEFAQAPRRTWDEFALTAAQTCAELLLRSQDPQSVIEMLTPLLAEEPYREGLASQLVLALHDADRHVEAVRVFDQTRDQLAEVGAEPGPALRASLQTVIRSTSTDAARTPARHNIPVRTTRLLGRTAILERLAEILDRSGSVRIAGIPGVGKSSLVASYAQSQVGELADGVFWIAARNSPGLTHELARVVSPRLARPVDPANAATVVGGLQALVVLDEPAPGESTSRVVGELLAGSIAKVIVVSQEDDLDMPVVTVPPLGGDDVENLFRSAGGELGEILEPHRLEELTGGVPSLVEFAAAASKVSTGRELSMESASAASDLLDVAIEHLGENDLSALASAASFHGPVSLLDIGSPDRRYTARDVVPLVDAGWLQTTAEGVAVPEVIRLRLAERGALDDSARAAHAARVASWPVKKAVARPADTEQAITYLARSAPEAAGDLFDRTAQALWDAGRFGVIARSARPLVGTGTSDAVCRNALFYGAYSGLRVGDVDFAMECAELFMWLAVDDPGHEVESAILGGDIAWFFGRLSDAAARYAEAQALASRSGDNREVLAAFGETLAYVHLGDEVALRDAADRVEATASQRMQSLVAESRGLVALVDGDLSSATASFEVGLRTTGFIDRRAIQRRLLETYLAARDIAGAEAAWATIEADAAYTGVALDPPTLFAGALHMHRVGDRRRPLSLLIAGARSLRVSPAALWLTVGLSVAVSVGPDGVPRDQARVALARMLDRTGMHLFAPYASEVRPSPGPVETEAIIEILLATEASTR